MEGGMLMEGMQQNRLGENAAMPYYQFILNEKGMPGKAMRSHGVTESV